LKYPIPNQVRNTIPIDFVKNPVAEYPRLITLPLCKVIHIPIIRCTRFKITGAKTPSRKYNTIFCILFYYLNINNGKYLMYKTRNHFIRSKSLGVGQARRTKQLPGHKEENLFVTYDG
tara:strand:- start:56 stop:409 length:354 start_codon:yes stop_codon:yes gene_type:complete